MAVMAELLPCVEVEAERAHASVIWLHGLGADGHDFEPVVPLLRTTGVRYVFPHAPAQEVTINGGMVMPAWYDIRSMDFDDDGREDPTQIEASMNHVLLLVEREGARGIASDHIVLAGFSQGAALALHTAVRHDQPLGGLLVLSGYLLQSKRLGIERHASNLEIPVLAAHGKHDDVVPITAGRACRDALARTGSDRGAIEWHEYSMGHEVCPDELERVGAWLRARWV
jgi:phospholipase/carboxylesterase